MTPANPNHPSWGGKRKPRQGKRIGRPPLHPKGLSRFYVNLSPDDLAWLDEQAGEMGTRAGVIRRLIDEARSGPWQTIESAPQDGTVILVYAAPRMYCNDLHPQEYAVAAFQEGEWMIEGTGNEWEIWHPTHWMPLPNPPEGE